MVDNQRIQAAITQEEAQTTGEIHVHLCKQTHQADTLAEATAIFDKYQLANTPGRNAILIFVAVKSKRFAVLGDIAIHEKMGQDFWTQVCDAMTAEFRQGDETQAILTGIRLCGEYLRLHFPASPGSRVNHLSDDVTEDK